jgi:hypothetical protein
VEFLPLPVYSHTSTTTIKGFNTLKFQYPVNYRHAQVEACIRFIFWKLLIKMEGFPVVCLISLNSFGILSIEAKSLSLSLPLSIIFLTSSFSVFFREIWWFSSNPQTICPDKMKLSLQQAVKTDGMQDIYRKLADRWC